MILKFWENEIAFCGDLKKTFRMIEIAQEDRKYVKFLWFPDKSDNSVQTLQPSTFQINDFSIWTSLFFEISHMKI